MSRRRPGRMSLADLGYSSFFRKNVPGAAKRDRLREVPARVISEHRKAYTVRTPEEELSARITGKMEYSSRSREDFPAVGDWVMVRPAGPGHAVIHGIFPRTSVLSRKYPDGPGVQVIAANIQTCFVVQSPDRDYSLNRIERYMTLCRSGGVVPAVILNKSDLLDALQLDEVVSEIRERFPGTEVYPTSLVTASGMEGFVSSLKKGRTYCLLGSSGVGKSSMINFLSGSEVLKVAGISRSTGRGRHVTSRRELFVLPCGALFIDNPGMREVALTLAGGGIQDVFRDLAGLAGSCRFSNCTHTHEPGCAVMGAVSDGSVSRQRYENYLRLVRENAFHSMTLYEKRSKDRAFGKMVRRVMDQKKKLRPE